MELISSRSLKNIDNAVFDRIKSYLDDNSKAFVIVPAQAMFLMEDQIIKRCKVDGFMSLEVVSFERLAEKIFEKTGGRSLNILTSSAMSMLVKRAIDQLDESLKVISVEDPTIHLLVANILTALKSEDITPDDLMKFYENASGIIKLKLYDLALIYKKVYEFNNANFFDKTDAEEYARNLIHKCDYIKNSKIIIYGFDVLPLSRIRTISELLRAGCDVTVALEADMSDELYKRQNKAIYSLEASARVADCTFSHTILNDTDMVTDDISHMRKYLYSYPIKNYNEKVTNIKLLQTDNKREEIALVTECILKAYHDGIDLSDIEILSSDPLKYMDYINDSFKKNNIPFFYDGKRKISSNRFTLYVLECVKLAASKNWNKNDVLKLIKSGYCNITEKEADRLVRCAYEHGIKGNAFKRSMASFSDEVEDIRFRALADIIELNVKNIADASQLAEHILAFLSRTNAEVKLKNTSELLKGFNLSKEERFIDQLYSKIQELLQQAVLLLRGVDKNRLYDILKCGCENTNIAVVPPMSNEISIGDITHSIFFKKKIMIIIGANDGNLPLLTESGIFSEYEAEKINEIGYFPGHISFEDQRLFIKRAFSSADKLLILYNKEDGNPALIINSLKNMFTKLEVTDTALKYTTVDGGLNLLSTELRCALDGDKFNCCVLPAYIRNDEGRDKLSKLVAVLNRDNLSRKITDSAAKNLYKNVSGSVSRIETFSKCPYKHFVQYGLKPDETAFYEETPLSSGIYVHSLIENVSKAIAEIGFLDITDSDLIKMTDAVASSEIIKHNKGIFYDSKRYSAIEAYLRDEAKDALLKVKKQLSDKRIRMLDNELELGRGSLDIETVNGIVKLSGKVDRVDIINNDGEEYVRVIDYKTGNHTFSIKNLYVGMDIQLAVYLIALMEKYSYKPGCGYYMNIELEYQKEGEKTKEYMYGFSLDKLGFEPKKGLSENQINMLLDHVRNIIGISMQRISEGHNEIDPIDDDACKYCDYRSICRVDEHALTQSRFDGYEEFMERYKHAADR